MIPNMPFRFLDSPDSLRNLRQALERVGLSAAESDIQEWDDNLSEFHPNRFACLRFTCRWLSQPVEIFWHFYWWPDGIHSELERVSVVYDGAVRGKVNVGDLHRCRLRQPLAEAIIDGIVATCAEVTGKPVQE